MRRVPDVVVGGIHSFHIHPGAVTVSTATITIAWAILIWQHFHHVADLARSDMSFRALEHRACGILELAHFLRIAYIMTCRPLTPINSPKCSWE
jgi:hypothetical protein